MFELSNEGKEFNQAKMGGAPGGRKCNDWNGRFAGKALGRSLFKGMGPTEMKSDA